MEPNKQKNVSEELDRTPPEVSKKLEDIRTRYAFWALLSLWGLPETVFCFPHHHRRHLASAMWQEGGWIIKTALWKPTALSPHLFSWNDWLPLKLALRLATLLPTWYMIHDPRFQCGTQFPHSPKPSLHWYVWLSCLLLHTPLIFNWFSCKYSFVQCYLCGRKEGRLWWD